MPKKRTTKKVSAGEKLLNKDKNAPKSYIVTIPQRADSLNKVAEWGASQLAVRKLKEQWKQISAFHFRQAMEEGMIPLRIIGRIKVSVWLFFDCERVRDSDNYFLMSKGIIDGIPESGLIPDDNSVYMDFGGINFRSSEQVRVDVQVDVYPNEKAKEIQAPIVNTDLIQQSIMAMGKDTEFYNMYMQGKISTEKMQYAYYLSMPKSIRPTKKEFADFLGVVYQTLHNWDYDPIVTRLALLFDRIGASHKIPNIMQAMEMKALTGDVPAARLFLEFVEQNKDHDKGLITPESEVDRPLTPQEVEDAILLLTGESPEKPEVVECSENSFIEG